VSGRELPLTSIASRDRKTFFEGSSGGPGPSPGHTSAALLGGDLLTLERGGDWLVGHRCPDEPGELAGDRDVGHVGSLAVAGEVPPAGEQPDLCLPSALIRLGPAVRAPWRMAVVPGRLDQQPASVRVTGAGDMPAVLGRQTSTPTGSFPARTSARALT
jgi:hypothetical protein